MVNSPLTKTQASWLKQGYYLSYWKSLVLKFGSKKGNDFLTLKLACLKNQFQFSALTMSVALSFN